MATIASVYPPYRSTRSAALHSARYSRTMCRRNLFAVVETSRSQVYSQRLSQTLCMTDDFNVSSPIPHAEGNIVVGCGGAAIDYLASVTSFPKPDDKIRTTELQVQGGGNVGNALTAASRLGLSTRIVSKIADDALGVAILSELEAEGIDTSHMVIARGGVSPFTYIIVDRQTNTRTCIHTPGSPPLHSAEVGSEAIRKLLQGATMAYFDGRLTEIAISIAEQASALSLPILVDAERPREGLDRLLHLAEFVVTSSGFPAAWTGEASLGKALSAMATVLPRAKLVVTTLGAQGCVALSRGLPAGNGMAVHATSAEQLDDVLSSLRKAAGASNERAPGVFSSQVLLPGEGGEDATVAQVLYCSAAELAAEDVVDTTGAGDAFIGALLYSFSVALPLEKALRLASLVAATKCKALGARPGLPRREDLLLRPDLA